MTHTPLPSLSLPPSQEERQRFLVPLAIEWERAALTGKMDLEAITALLDAASANIGRDWMQNLARGFTASALRQTLDVLQPILATLDTRLLGKTSYESDAQWFDRLEKSGPDVVYDFLDKVRTLMPRAYRPGDHEHQQALLSALVSQVDKQGLSPAAAMAASHRAIKGQNTTSGPFIRDKVAP